MKCEEIKQLLTQYALGDLDKTAGDEVRAHLEKCGSCRASLLEIEPTLDLLRDALAAPSNAPKRLSEERKREIKAPALDRGKGLSFWIFRHHGLASAAAAGLLGVGILWMLLSSTRYPEKHESDVSYAVEMIAPDTMRVHDSEKAVADVSAVRREAKNDIDEDGTFKRKSHPDELERTRISGQVPGAGRIDQNEYASRSSVGQLSGAKVSLSQRARQAVAQVPAASAPAAGVAPVDPFSAAPIVNAPAAPMEEERQPESKERMEELKVQTPKPRFVGTPVNLKSISKAEHDHWLAQTGRAVDSQDRAAKTDENALISKKQSGEARTDLSATSQPVVEQRKLDELEVQQEPMPAMGLTSETRTAVAGKEFKSIADGKGVGVGGDMDIPTEPFCAVMTKSPVIVKGLYGNRTTGGREVALRAYGGGGAGSTEGAVMRSSKSDDQNKDIKIEVSSIVKEKEVEEDKSGPRFKAYGVNPFVATKDQPFSTFGIDCDTASYTLARNYMSKGLLPPAEAVRTEEFVNFFDYAYKAPDTDTFRIYIDCAPSKFGRGLQMMKIGVKGRRLGREEQRQASLTFLVDTSGSMEQPDRIVLVKKSLRMLVGKLNQHDLVSIVKYDSHARIVIERVPASEKQRILDAIDSVECGGSTNLEEGMDRAYQIASRNFVSKGENRVLLMSDGVANLGGMAAKEILQRVEKYRRQGIFCSVFGFGIGTYDDEMLEELANKGDGTYKFIDSEEEARQVFVNDLSANLNTIAKDVKIQVEFNPKRVTRYRQIGYENRQLKKEDFRNDKIDAGEVGSGQSVTALYEMELGGVTIQTSQFRSQNSESRMIYPDREPVATVRVRYQRVDNGQVEEIERTLKAEDILSQFDQADSRFKLAVCAAQFAEMLRGSPFAEGREFQDVARVLAPVALELNLDGRVQELIKMVNGAKGLSRGQ